MSLCERVSLSLGHCLSHVEVPGGSATLDPKPECSVQLQINKLQRYGRDEELLSDGWRGTRDLVTAVT